MLTPKHKSAPLQKSPFSAQILAPPHTPNLASSKFPLLVHIPPLQFSPSQHKYPPIPSTNLLPHPYINPPKSLISSLPSFNNTYALLSPKFPLPTQLFFIPIFLWHPPNILPQCPLPRAAARPPPRSPLAPALLLVQRVQINTDSSSSSLQKFC